MIDNRYPIAKLLTPSESEPWQIVTLNDVDWWRKITPMETADREDRLRCPFCDGRFKFCSGPILGSYFRHKRGEGSCLGSARGGSNAASPYPPNRTMWIRYKFARLLRHLLPDGTVVDDKPALTRLDGHMIVTLPDGGQCAVEVDCGPAGYSSLASRWDEHRLERRPVIWVFSGDRLITRSVAQGVGVIETTLDPILLAFMEKGDPYRPKARPFVDRAYRELTSVQLSNSPLGSLLFYLPGKGDKELGTVVGLRGLMPDRKDTWVGTLLRAEVLPAESHPMRFCRRRGLYFDEDIDMVRCYRLKCNEQRRQRRERMGHTTSVLQTAPAAQQPPTYSGGRGGVTHQAAKPANLVDMVAAPPGQWMDAMLAHFLEVGRPFTIAEACSWVHQNYTTHPAIAPRDLPFLTEMRFFWEKVAERGQVTVVDSRPVAVIPNRLVQR